MNYTGDWDSEWRKAECARAQSDQLQTTQLEWPHLYNALNWPSGEEKVTLVSSSVLEDKGAVEH